MATIQIMLDIEVEGKFYRATSRDPGLERGSPVVEDIEIISISRGGRTLRPGSNFLLYLFEAAAVDAIIEEQSA